VKDFDAYIAPNRRDRVPYTIVASLRNVHHTLLKRIDGYLRCNPLLIMELHWQEPAEYGGSGSIRQKLYRLLRILSLSEWSRSRFLDCPFQVYIASYVDIPANWIENLPKHVQVHRMNVDMPQESKKLPKLRVEKRRNTKVLESGSKRQKV